MTIPDKSKAVPLPDRSEVYDVGTSLLEEFLEKNKVVVKSLKDGFPGCFLDDVLFFAPHFNTLKVFFVNFAATSANPRV